MTVNFNPVNKVINPNKTGQQKKTTQTTGSQERNQVSWDQTLPGSNAYTGQPIKINLQEVVVTASKKPRDFKVASNGFLIRSKDSNPAEFKELQYEVNGKTVTKIIANNVEIYGTKDKDEIIVEGDKNSIYGGSGSDKFYVKGNDNDINPDSYNWSLSSDGKKVKLEEINKAGQYKTNVTGADKIFVFGQNNTINTDDDTRSDKICTYEPGNGFNSNKIDTQTNGKDNFYRFNDNYDPEKPVAVVYDNFEGSGSHGNKVRNTLVKGGYKRNHNRDLIVKTFDYDYKGNKWKTNFIDEERFPEAKAKLEALNEKEFPEGSNERFTKGLEILEESGINIDIINNSTDPSFFKAKEGLEDGFKYTFKELGAYVGGNANINAHNLDNYSPRIIKAIDTKLETEKDPAKIERMKDVKNFLENREKVYASYSDLSNMINEERGPKQPQVKITEGNIDSYREELIQILDKDAKKPESERKTRWADLQYVRDILEDGKYPYANAAGNNRAGIGLTALTDHSITVSGKEYDLTYDKGPAQDVHQSSLVDQQEFVEVYGNRGTSISAPLYCRRYIEDKTKVYQEMQEVKNTYFK